MAPHCLSPCCCSSLLLVLLSLLVTVTSHGFEISEATIEGLHKGFAEGRLTSSQLVEYYLDQIQALNPLLHAVIEVNPDALRQADRADWERRKLGRCDGLHGIPVLLKDNIATKDKLNTTAGSLALLGSVVPRDAGVVTRLRTAGAVILGKASVSEWSNFRSANAPSGWSARGGQGKNPYKLSANVCGSSSGSAIAAGANMAAVTIGTETAGSIICPTSFTSLVGIKPTVGLTSRSGVMPISARQDTIGPICRTVSDAVEVLEAIVGFDPMDASATRSASKYIPNGGYKQFLKADGLKGKRLGILRKGFFDRFSNGSIQARVYEQHFQTMRGKGAILVDNLEIANTSVIQDTHQSGEFLALLAEFKLYINKYLSELSYSPVRSLADVIAFNNNHTAEEKITEYGQQMLLLSENTTGIDASVRSAFEFMNELSKDGIETLMRDEKLDAILTTNADAIQILAIGGYPGISVPAGFGADGVPFGLTLGGLKGSEPKLIEIAYAFEQAAKVRKPPTFMLIEREQHCLLNNTFNQ